MATLTALLAAQSRVDDGTATDADRVAAAELDRMLHESAWNVLDFEYQWDMERFERWHAEQECDGENCRHYEPKEA